MLKVELKRILKTPSTWWLTGIAFAFCVIFAVMTIRFSSSVTYDENNNIETRSGVAGYNVNREKYSLIEGEITPELIAEVVRQKHQTREQYGDDYNAVTSRSIEVLGPYAPVYAWIIRSFTNENGIGLTADDLSYEQALDFYPERLKTLERTLEKKYGKSPQVISYAMSRAAGKEEHFNYTYGIGSTNVYEHLALCTFLVIAVCVVITAPIFSSDYASGADDILRCSKRGRKRLALTKLGSGMIISMGIFILCIGAFLVIVYLAFGFDDNTSAELLDFAWNPNSLTAMGILGMMLLVSFITLIAMVGFTLLLSSHFKNTVIVLAISVAILMIPNMVLFSGADGNILNWFRFCLPSGGALVAGGMMHEFSVMRFLWAGNYVAWSIYVIIAAAAVQVPLWIGLTVRSYDKHQAV